MTSAAWAASSFLSTALPPTSAATSWASSISVKDGHRVSRPAQRRSKSGTNSAGADDRNIHARSFHRLRSQRPTLLRLTVGEARPPLVMVDPR